MGALSFCEALRTTTLSQPGLCTFQVPSAVPFQNFNQLCPGSLRLCQGLEARCGCGTGTSSQYYASGFLERLHTSSFKVRYYGFLQAQLSAPEPQGCSFVCSFGQQSRVTTDAKSIQWDMTKPRRKSYRRKPRKRKLPRPDLSRPLCYLAIALACIYYYTTPARGNPAVVFLDALVVHSSLYSVCLGLNHAFQVILQQNRNRAVHSINGKPHILALDSLIPIASLAAEPTNAQSTPPNSPNEVMHSTNRNPRTLALDSLVPPASLAVEPTIVQSTPQYPPKPPNIDPMHLVLGPDRVAYSPAFLLSFRRPPKECTPIICLGFRPKYRRTGYRKQYRDPNSGVRSFKTIRPLRTSNRTPLRGQSLPSQAKPNSSNSDNSAPTLYKPTPPQRGTPGSTLVDNEECLPLTSSQYCSLLGRGSRARLLRRRLYRQWKRSSRESICLRSLGKTLIREDKPQNAAKQKQRTKLSTARIFRERILKQHHPHPRKTPVPKLATPQLSYGKLVKVATQNVQSLAEILKHQSLLDIMTTRKLDILFITETRITSYHSYISKGFWFIHNGNTRDRYGGVGAIVAPSFRPFVKDVVQHNSRHFEIVVAMKSAPAHFHGVYAPHDKTDEELQKTPFWTHLEEVCSATPLPEPFYVIGDFKKRLQGRTSKEMDYIGPHILGRGPQYINPKPGSNRQLYLQLLRTIDGVDVMSFKQPDLKKQITYKDKHTPPLCWSQFVQDPFEWLQFWDKVYGITNIGAQETQCSIDIAANTRQSLTTTPLLDPPDAPLGIDPRRFQSLDKLTTRSKWLPTVHKIFASHSAGFPSDHYLLEAHIRIKLAARPPKQPPRFRPDYSAISQNAKLALQETIRAELGYAPLPSVQVLDGECWEIFTDGSGTSGKSTKTTPAGWGFVVTKSEQHDHSASGPSRNRRQV